jgi:hypothetical protein
MQFRENTKNDNYDQKIARSNTLFYLTSLCIRMGLSRRPIPSGIVTIKCVITIESLKGKFGIRRLIPRTLQKARYIPRCLNSDSWVRLKELQLLHYCFFPAKPAT